MPPEAGTNQTARLGLNLLAVPDCCYTTSNRIEAGNSSWEKSCHSASWGMIRQCPPATAVAHLQGNSSSPLSYRYVLAHQGRQEESLEACAADTPTTALLSSSNSHRHEALLAANMGQTHVHFGPQAACTVCWRGQERLYGAGCGRRV